MGPSYDDDPPDFEAEAIAHKALQWRRRMLGLFMLASVVILWTASNFLGSAVLADQTYNKPYFLTYLNTAFFTIPLLPLLVIRARQHPGESRQWMNDLKAYVSGSKHHPHHKRRTSILAASSATTSRRASLSDSQTLLLGQSYHDLPTEVSPSNALSIPQHMSLAWRFAPLWFLANYWIAVSLQHTTVASSTILTSTSSIFTLFFGVATHVETFTWRKLFGVLGSLAGICLVSSVDFSGKSSDEEHRGDFPEKTPAQMIWGNALALAAAAVYGAYTVLMKKRLPNNEQGVSLPLLFSLIGVVNIVTLWPGFLILHFCGVESFVLPPSATVTWIIMSNGLTSVVADLCWAQAVLLTGPIVVTVGLSLSIPLSLVGQMVVNGQSAPWAYWVGAGIVVGAFVFINIEEGREGDGAGED